VTKATLPTLSDMDKLKSTLRQFVRDWSRDGLPERQVCYAPVITEVTKRFQPNTWYVLQWEEGGLGLYVHLYGKNTLIQNCIFENLSLVKENCL